MGELVYRALLCRRCNQAVGAFEWSDDTLKRAATYLLRIVDTRAYFFGTIVKDSISTGGSDG